MKHSVFTSNYYVNRTTEGGDKNNGYLFLTCENCYAVADIIESAIRRMLMSKASSNVRADSHLLLIIFAKNNNIWLLFNKETSQLISECFCLTEQPMGNVKQLVCSIYLVILYQLLGELIWVSALSSIVFTSLA